MVRYYAAGACCVLLGVVATLGCGRSETADAMISDANQTNLQRLSNLYAFYQTKNQWQGPADETEFKKFISGLDVDILQRMGIDSASIDQLFNSERDNQPFTIRYSVQGSMRGIKAPIIFEQVGVDGQRMVAFTAAPPREVDETEYKRLLSGEMDAGASVANRGSAPSKR